MVDNVALLIGNNKTDVKVIEEEMTERSHDVNYVATSLLCSASLTVDSFSPASG